jgi:hypothetical protein
LIEAEMDHGGSSEAAKPRFEPKKAVTLNPPKDDPITVEELAKGDGMFSLLFFMFGLSQRSQSNDLHF